ncbi:hypothetical protein JCM16303_006003 [Sporobolomyces ruberrimus]
MLVLQKVALLLVASVASAAVVPISAADRIDQRQDHQLVARQSECNSDTHLEVNYKDARISCISWTGIKYIGGSVFGLAIVAVGPPSIAKLVEAYAKLVTARRSGSASISSPVRRLARRDEDQGQEMAYFSFGGVEVATSFVQHPDGKTTVDILDLLRPSSPALNARAVTETGGDIFGGSATFNTNGTLDTFTIDLAVPSTVDSADSTSPALTKRNYNTLHTTYWAEPGHAETSLSYDKLYELIHDSYTHLPDRTAQVCGYLANSGKWHGAFRHWTGDNGYQVGECEGARKF